MITKCKHCKQEFDLSDKSKGWMANHSRWCDKNPKKSDYVNDMGKARAAKTKEGRRIAAEKVKILHKEGRYDHVDRKTFLGKRHSEESKKKISEAALKSKHRRLRKGIVEYNGVLLDSSWELALARRLDELGVSWIRPEPIEWVDKKGKTHNYFADFYLIDYDLYLDPKNPYAIAVQKDKLKILLNQYKNIQIISSFEKCKSYSPVAQWLERGAYTS